MITSVWLFRYVSFCTWGAMLIHACSMRSKTRCGKRSNFKKSVERSCGHACSGSMNQLIPPTVCRSHRNHQVSPRHPRAGEKTSTKSSMHPPFPQRYNRSSLLAGFQHVIILVEFDDGVKWLARIRQKAFHILRYGIGTVVTDSRGEDYAPAAFPWLA